MGSPPCEQIGVKGRTLCRDAEVEEEETGEAGLV